ncbi:unnamed protein product, partial [Hapterophycus canaliculatus]
RVRIVFFRRSYALAHQQRRRQTSHGGLGPRRAFQVGIEQRGSRARGCAKAQVGNAARETTSALVSPAMPWSCPACLCFRIS